MIDPQLWGLAQTFGVAAPIVALLVYMVREATAERARITDRFLSSLEGVVRDSTDARLRSAQALNDLTGAIREHDRRSSEEHARLMDRTAAAAR